MYVRISHIYGNSHCVFFFSVAASNSKGFFVANFYTKSLILIQPTVMSDGVEARNISKVQSIRRSLRSSLRRRSTIASANEERRKIAASLNLEMGLANTKPPSRSADTRRRIHSDDFTSVIGPDGPIVGGGVPPDQKGNVTNLVFAETHIAG